MKLSFSGLYSSLSVPSRTVETAAAKTSPRGHYQDLLETLGVLKSQSSKALPTNIKEVKEISKTEKKNLPDLGLPVGRRDAQLLIKWLDGMLSKVSSNSSSLESILDSALSIYDVCFHEIVRQVSVQCKERGELISRVWKAYINLLERALRISQASQHTQMQIFKQEKENIKAMTTAEVFKLKCEVEEKNLEILSHVDKLTGKDEEINKLNLINKRLVHRLEIIREHYENVKKEIVSLKEENRVLKRKLLNTETEFIVNDHGVIEAQQKRVRIKIKSQDKLEEIVTKDPIIRSGSLVDVEEQENLPNDIKVYEKEMEEIFSQVDFKDQGIDAPLIQLDSKESQTEVEISCGDSLGEAKVQVDSTSLVIELIDLQLQAMLTAQDDKELERRSTMRQKEVEEVLKNNENNEKIQGVLEKMKENISGFSQPMISSLYNTMSSALKDTRPTDSRHETKRLKTIRKKMWTVIQASRLKKNNEISAVLIQKIKKTPQHKLKKVIVKKILLKFITVFYEAKLQKRMIDPELSKRQEISQLCLEVLSNKYGPGKMAESKFTQIFSSVIKYKHIKRVRLFGRFLKLFDDFDSEDLEYFLDFLSFLKNSQSKDYQNTESSEIFYISYDKAIDLYRSPLVYKLSDTDRKTIKHFIESNKSTDLLNKIQIIDQDAYLEFLIERARSKKNARVNFLKCIYEAADLNDDGYLQQVEFDLLARHMSVIPLADGFTTEVFNEFAETFTDENEVAVQALSFENFSVLSGTYEVFSVESMQTFSKITHPQGAIWHIKQVTPHIDTILHEIHWRLSHKDNWKDYEDEYNLVLEVIKNKVISQKNPESVWIALRLLQEESKHICIENALKTLMPNVQSLVITTTNIL